MDIETIRVICGTVVAVVGMGVVAFFIYMWMRNLPSLDQDFADGLDDYNPPEYGYSTVTTTVINDKDGKDLELDEEGKVALNKGMDSLKQGMEALQLAMNELQKKGKK